MKEVRLLRAHDGSISEADFTLVERPEPVPVPGEVVTRTLWISIDPYLALRIRDHADMGTTDVPYPMTSRTIGVVVHGDGNAFSAGDFVLGFGRWAEFDTRPPTALTKIDDTDFPISAHLGAAGHSGFTAWLGLKLGQLNADETVLVSGAAGAVGSIAGQLAKAAGCRVIGIAGGPEKAGWVTELGFDACVDHRRPDLAAQIRDVAPDGIDLHFENVGSATLDPALANMQRRGRVMLCGLVQHYQSTAPVALMQFRRLLEASIRIEPFSIYDHADLFPKARADLAAALRNGSLKRRETVAHGIEQLPSAFVSMLAGRGSGKHLVSLM